MSETTTIYLIRHGETVWNADHDRYCGWTDVSLSERGREQLKRLAERFRGVRLDRICASPLKRAVETAQAVAAGRGIRVEQVKGLIECHFGEWEGLTREEIRQRDPERYQLWRDRPSEVLLPGGETYAQVAQRFKQSMLDIVNQSQPGSHVLVVAHKTSIRLFLSDVLGAPLDHSRLMELDNTGVSVLRYEQIRGDSREFVIVNMNDTNHLTGL
ncbi:histidine phosphatase family protein [Brevibacillus sp. B_LB10_24]|uniref:histidine phosphatase family protein n=1 Tax=Brevibacillus sp. B_LB10_24 TaxID=3380645 RepID=UPI0038B6BF0F